MTAVSSTPVYDLTREGCCLSTYKCLAKTCLTERVGKYIGTLGSSTASTMYAYKGPVFQAEIFNTSIGHFLVTLIPWNLFLVKFLFAVTFPAGLE